MFCSHLMVLIKNPCDDQEHKEWGVREMGTGTDWAAGKVFVHVCTCPRTAFGSWLDMPPLMVLYLRTHAKPAAQCQLPASLTLCAVQLISGCCDGLCGVQFILWWPLWSQFVLWWPLWVVYPLLQSLPSDAAFPCLLLGPFIWSISTDFLALDIDVFEK